MPELTIGLIIALTRNFAKEDAADDLVLVTTPEPTSVADAHAAINRFRRLAAQPRLLAVAEGFEQSCAFSLLRLGVKGLMRFEEAPTQLERAVKEIEPSLYTKSGIMLGLGETEEEVS